MKGIGIILLFIITISFVTDQEIWAFSEPPTKDEKQFMSTLYLIGFVGIYGGIIYLRKSYEMKTNSK